MDVQGDRDNCPNTVTTAVSLCTYYVGHLVEVQYDYHSSNRFNPHN